jgi:hypothetical protein
LAKQVLKKCAKILKILGKLQINQI